MPPIRTSIPQTNRQWSRIGSIVSPLGVPIKITQHNYAKFKLSLRVSTQHTKDDHSPSPQHRLLDLHQELHRIPSQPMPGFHHGICFTTARATAKSWTQKFEGTHQWPNNPSQ